MVGYVTVAEANAYIVAHYTASNADRIAWLALEDDDKEIYLLQSVEALDTLQYSSRPYSITQTYAFPRGTSTTVPNAVKYAQIENALVLSREEDLSEYEKMDILGITSYSISDFRETRKRNSYKPNVVSSKALQLLGPYLLRGCQIV